MSGGRACRGVADAIGFDGNIDNDEDEEEDEDEDNNDESPATACELGSTGTKAAAGGGCVGWKDEDVAGPPLGVSKSADPLGDDEAAAVAASLLRGTQDCGDGRALMLLLLLLLALRSLLLLSWRASSLTKFGRGVLASDDEVDEEVEEFAQEGEEAEEAELAAQRASTMKASTELRCTKSAGKSSRNVGGGRYSGDANSDADASAEEPAELEEEPTGDEALLARVTSIGGVEHEPKPKDPSARGVRMRMGPKGDGKGEPAPPAPPAVSSGSGANDDDDDEEGGVPTASLAAEAMDSAKVRVRLGLLLGVQSRLLLAARGLEPGRLAACAAASFSARSHRVL